MSAEDGRGDDVLFGLGEFHLVGTRIGEDDVELTVETAVGEGWCCPCGGRGCTARAYETVVRDLETVDRLLRLGWRKRHWRYSVRVCPAGWWTEEITAIRPRMSLSGRARGEPCRRVGRQAQLVASATRGVGTGWHTIDRAVWHQGQPLVDDSARTTGVLALGVGELRLRQLRRATCDVTGLVDLTRGRALDVVDGRPRTAVSRWLTGRDPQWIGRGRACRPRLYQECHNALVDGLDAPEVLVDAFHTCELANDAVAETCRRVERDTAGIRRLLLAGCERLFARGYQRFDAGLEAGDPHHDAWHARIVTEAVRDRYRAASEPAPPAVCSPSWTPPPPSRCPSAGGWCAPSPAGKTRCWPTTTATACPTPPPKRSTPG